jgi:molybdopterin converting factor small subunit
VARVTIELPRVVSQVVDGRHRVAVEAVTLSGALEELVRALPALEVQLFVETGGFRQHVLCFHNGTNTRWLESLDRELADGDTIRLLQAVSGG